MTKISCGAISAQIYQIMKVEQEKSKVYRDVFIRTPFNDPRNRFGSIKIQMKAVARAVGVQLLEKLLDREEVASPKTPRKQRFQTVFSESEEENYVHDEPDTDDNAGPASAKKKHQPGRPRLTFRPRSHKNVHTISSPVTPRKWIRQFDLNAKPSSSGLGSPYQIYHADVEDYADDKFPVWHESEDAWRGRVGFRFNSNESHTKLDKDGFWPGSFYQKIVPAYETLPPMLLEARFGIEAKTHLRPELRPSKWIRYDRPSLSNSG